MYTAMFYFFNAGNILILRSISIYQELQTPTNLILASLAVVDLLISLTLPLYAVSYFSLFFSWNFNLSDICFDYYLKCIAFVSVYYIILYKGETFGEKFILTLHVRKKSRSEWSLLNLTSYKPDLRKPLETRNILNSRFSSCPCLSMFNLTSTRTTSSRRYKIPKIWNEKPSSVIYWILIDTTCEFECVFPKVLNVN